MINEACESSPGLLLLRCVRDILNDFANGDALTHIFVHLELSRALDPATILRKICAPTVVLPLKCKLAVYLMAHPRRQDLLFDRQSRASGPLTDR